MAAKPTGAASGLPPLSLALSAGTCWSFSPQAPCWLAKGQILGQMPLAAAAVQAILTGDRGAEGQLGQFSDNVLHDCKVVSCEPQRLVVTLPVTARITNSSANLHGGASCTLVDTLSALCQPRRYPPFPPRPCLCVCVLWTASAALLINDFRMSVTIDLHITCVSAAPLGSRLEVESTVEQAGKSILFTSCRIFTLGEGGKRTLVAAGVHTKKVVAGQWAHPQIVSPKPKL